jgi:signal transduction histidine kinase
MRRFLADASHELRNPVAGIQATGETLLRDGEDRGRREALTVTLVRESRRASRLVGDLLSAARAESERGLERRPLDLARVVREAAQRDAPLGHARPLELDAPEPVVVQADPDRVAQIVGALVDNARRAAPGGRVRLTVARAGAGAVLEVHDDGPGVPEADRERFFGRFVQVGPRDRRGSGLGLTIARALAEAHGGGLTCGASPLGGALLRLWLPAGRQTGPTTMC